MSVVTYIPTYDKAGSIVAIGRVYMPSGKSEYIANDAKGWKPDPTGIYYRAWDSSEHDWITEDEARRIVKAWGSDL